MIEYDLCDGTKAEPYKSTLTTVEGLLQTLATIAAMGMLSTRACKKVNLLLDLRYLLWVRIKITWTEKR